MPGPRYVLLGLAGARSTWFRDVAQWANASSIPSEFVKCLSAEEVRARLSGGRAFSALLVDAALPVLDRDLVDTAKQAGCAVIVVDDQRRGREWVTLGANALLPSTFSRKDLLEVLAAHTVMIGRSDGIASGMTSPEAMSWQAPMAVVCGSGGTGTSTVAMALSQGLASDVRFSGSVILADFALRGEQAMLHDARDVAPGVQELVEAFRAGNPAAEEIRSIAYAVDQRRYALLLGLRRPRAWSSIRPRAFAAALDGLRQCYRAVVADVDADVEGEDEGGSMDVEERHTMARTAISAADVVFVVGMPGMKGLYSNVRVVSELLSFGVPAQRVVPVFNRSLRSGRARTELTAAFTSLLPDWAGPELNSPMHLPERRVDEALRDGVRLPTTLSQPLARMFDDVLRKADDEARRPVALERVVPGSIGHWDSAEVADG
jgi:hypothetical protein